MNRLSAWCTAATFLLVTTCHAQSPARSQSKDDTKSRLERARQWRREGKFEDAVRELREVTAAEPTNYLAQYNLGLALSQTGKTEDLREAVIAFELAAEIAETENRKDPTVYNSLGWAQLLAGKYEAAEKSLEKAASDVDRLSPVSAARVFNNLGWVYLYQGRTDEAREAFEKASVKYGSKVAASNLRLLPETQ